MKIFNFKRKNSFLIEKKTKNFTKKKKSSNFGRFQRIEALIDFVHPENITEISSGRKNYLPDIFQNHFPFK